MDNEKKQGKALITEAPFKRILPKENLPLFYSPIFISFLLFSVFVGAILSFLVKKDNDKCPEASAGPSGVFWKARHLYAFVIICGQGISYPISCAGRPSTILRETRFKDPKHCMKGPFPHGNCPKVIELSSEKTPVCWGACKRAACWSLQMISCDKRGMQIDSSLRFSFQDQRTDSRVVAEMVVETPPASPASALR